MFLNFLNKYDWDAVQKQINAVDKSEIEKVLLINNYEHSVLDNFLTLISPLALTFLPQLIERSQHLTQTRFGKTIQLFAPLYLSNECQNICTYCGFSLSNKIPRKTLSDIEILEEIEVLKKMGYEHILLVTGEHDKLVGINYILNAVQLAKQHFAQVSIEVQPLEEEEYIILKNAGVFAVLVYQETYNKEAYKKHHPKGKKANFEYRLDTPDRLGKAEIHKIGLGVLLGLEDWRVDSFFAALHLECLQKTYWKTKYSISFPRIRPHEGSFEPVSTLSEKELLQLICAYRICFPDVEISLSSRERAIFRDAVFPYGITSMSAGSKTEPGGYTNSNALKQFEIHDDRQPKEVAEAIWKKGYEVVWKDWENIEV